MSEDKKTQRKDRETKVQNKKVITRNIDVDSSCSIQAILNRVENEECLTIHFENGTYREKLIVDKPNIIFIGESAEGVILDWDDASGTLDRENMDKENPEKTYGTFRSASVTITPNGEGFVAENITFRNSFDYDNSNLKDRQAVALKNDGDRTFFYNCRFIGKQDTLCANTGRQYYKGGYIEGHVDFIFGAAQAYFEDMIIFSKDREGDEKGYVFAPSTLETENLGYLVNNCEFRSELKAETIYLGRPWHPGKKPGVNPSLLVMNCNLGAHIKTYPWASMSGFSPEDARFFEYENYGEGWKSHPERRLLNEEELKNWNKKSLFKDWIPS